MMPWQGAYSYRQGLVSDYDAMAFSHLQTCFMLSHYVTEHEGKHGKRPTPKEVAATFTSRTRQAGCAEPLKDSFATASASCSMCHSCDPCDWTHERNV